MIQLVVIWGTYAPFSELWWRARGYCISVQFPGSSWKSFYNLKKIWYWDFVPKNWYKKRKLPTKYSHMHFKVDGMIGSSHLESLLEIKLESLKRSKRNYSYKKIKLQIYIFRTSEESNFGTLWWAQSPSESKLWLKVEIVCLLN